MPSLSRTASEYPLNLGTPDVPVGSSTATGEVEIPPPNLDSTPTRPQNGRSNATADGFVTPRQGSVTSNSVFSLTTLSPTFDIEQMQQA